jgi:alpha,alpha-trehalase
MLGQLAARGPILLCLDYDGTISELVSRPAMARPVEGAVAAITSMTAHADRIAIAIVSGRPIVDLRRMTGLGGEVMYAGVHGLEIAGRTGENGADVIRTADETARCAVQLDRVRAWLTRNVAPQARFEVEDKGLAIALHYRNAEPAAADALCARFEEFVRTDAPDLRAAHNKMVVEALPVAASKGVALRKLWHEVGADFLPVYFGDDRTDEDAFAELVSRGVGVGVLVGEPRPSLARWRVAGPAEVARVLTTLAASLA